MKRKLPTIASQLNKWLLLIMVLIFLLTTALSVVIQYKVTMHDTERLLKVSIEDEIRELTHFVSETQLLGMYFLKAFLQPGYTDLASIPYDEVSIIDENGIVLESTNKNMIGVDLDSNDATSGFFKELREKKELLSPIPQSAGDPSEIIQYIGTELDNGMYVMGGFSQDNIDSIISEAVTEFISSRHVNQNGMLFIIDENNTVVSKPYDDSSQDIDKMLEGREIQGETGEIREVSVNGVTYYRVFDTISNFKIVAVLSQKKVMENIRINLILSSVLGMILFVTLFISVSMLMKRKVTRPVKEIAGTLASITGGELDEKVSVRSSSEFETISEGINKTVASIKKHIARETARIDEELRYAWEIQYSALPVLTEGLKNNRYFGLFSSMNTAKEVGGDFYDFYMTDEHTLVFMIADVSGKGIPAAMFMMKGKATLSDSIVSADDLGESVSRANVRICDGNEAGMFITAWVGVLDILTGELRFVNAGHNPPVLIRNGKAEFLKMKTDLILGMMDDAEYQTQSLKLRKGDILYLYTDGVTEATDTNSGFYGEKRLIAALNGISPNEEDICGTVCRKVSDSVAQFAGGAPQADDTTMLCLRFKGGS